MLRILIALLLTLGCSSTYLWAKDNGQWAQVDPKVRDWFNSQKSRSGVHCCTVADGTYAEQEERGSSYWTRWRMPDGKMTDWIEVPESAVLYRTASPTGSAVVWWGANPDGTLMVRCYVPASQV